MRKQKYYKATTRIEQCITRVESCDLCLFATGMRLQRVRGHCDNICILEGQQSVYNVLAASYLFLSTTHYHEAEFPWSITNANSFFRHIQLSYRFLSTSQRFKGCTRCSNHRLPSGLENPLCRTWKISGVIFG